VVVTQERAKQMALPRDSRGRPIRTPAAAQADAAPSAAAKDDSGDNNRSGMRSVGPQFMPTR
jgi:hypothetical protein